MAVEKNDALYAAALRREATGRTTVDLPLLWHCFYELRPELRGEVSARQRLATALGRLAEDRFLNFPASKNSFDSTALPLLPRFVRLLGDRAPEEERFDHEIFPWSLPMTFVAALPRLPNPDIALRLNLNAAVDRDKKRGR